MSRIRTNFITNRMANGAPTVSNGLVVSGVTTTTNLNVTSDVVVGGGLTVGGVLTYEDVTNIDSVGMITARTDITLGDSIIHLGDTDTKMRFPADDIIAFDTAGTEKVRIATNGSVGIGTVNPNTRLHIHHPTTNGVALFESSDAYCHLIFKDSNSTTSTLPHFGVQGDDFRFVNDGGERLRITSTGRIEQTTNDENIDMDSAANGQLKLDGNGFSAGFALNNQGLNIYHNSASRALIFGTNEIERVRITQDGLVGINTTNPTGPRLEIVDSNVKTWTPSSQTELLIERNGNCLLSIVGKSDSNSVINFGDNDDENAGHIDYDHASNSMAFRTNTTEKLRIASAGQIGLSGTNYGTAGQVLTSGGASAAPSWSGGARRVLEVVASNCDGTVVPTSNGNITFANVTGPQDLSTSYANVQGSIISYQPPSGTQQVIYEFNMQVTNHDDATSIGHFKFYIDGSEVVYARRGISAEDVDVYVNFKYVINIGGSANANTGRIASWSSAKEMKMTAREYHSTNNAVSLHETDHWDGAGTNMFSQPVLQITAIGV